MNPSPFLTRKKLEAVADRLNKKDHIMLYSTVKAVFCFLRLFNKKETDNNDHQQFQTLLSHFQP